MLVLVPGVQQSEWHIYVFVLDFFPYKVLCRPDLLETLPKGWEKEKRTGDRGQGVLKRGLECQFLKNAELCFQVKIKNVNTDQF